MTDTTEMVEMIDPVTGEIIDQKQLAEQLLAQAKAQGMSLVGPGGLLSGLTKQVLETALEAELTEHLGHEHDETDGQRNQERQLSGLHPPDPGLDQVCQGQPSQCSPLRRY